MTKTRRVIVDAEPEKPARRSHGRAKPLPPVRRKEEPTTGKKRGNTKPGVKRGPYAQRSPRLPAELVQRTIRVARRAGFTMDEISAELGVAKPTTYYWERMERPPMGKMRPAFLRLCKRF